MNQPACWPLSQWDIPMAQRLHYNDIIMSAIASHITSLTIVYSIVYSDADQRKHQSSASLVFVRQFTGDQWIPRINDQLRGKCFHLMTSSWGAGSVSSRLDGCLISKPAGVVGSRMLQYQEILDLCLTHSGLMMPYGDMNQPWLRW